MNTALANKNGELVMPVLVTGSFQSPRIAPDLETIARMKMENLLPTGANPGKLSSGILGSILGGKSQQNQAMPQEDRNGVQGVLDQLRGKQQQQQPAGNQPAQPNGTQPQQQSQTGQQQQQQQKKGWSDVLQEALKKRQQKKEQQQQQQQEQQQQQQEQPK
jgi:hypothetical protein